MSQGWDAEEGQHGLLGGGLLGGGLLGGPHWSEEPRAVQMLDTKATSTKTANTPTGSVSF